jgi:hypothetical protein
MYYAVMSGGPYGAVENCGEKNAPIFEMMKRRQSG